jgi:hypothetical protein
MDTSSYVLVWMGCQGRIDSAKGDEYLVSLTKPHNILIRDNSGCDGTYIWQNNGFGNVIVFEISGKLLRDDQFIIAFIEFRSGRFLVVVNPSVPMFFESDVDMKVDSQHGLRIPDFFKQKKGMVLFSYRTIPFFALDKGVLNTYIYGNQYWLP